VALTELNWEMQSHISRAQRQTGCRALAARTQPRAIVVAAAGKGFGVAKAKAKPPTEPSQPNLDPCPCASGKNYKVHLHVWLAESYSVP
jgi:hypothetical protein